MAAAIKRTLKQKRILVTDIENEFGKELQADLRGEGAIVFTFVRECILIQQVMKDFPEVIPILLDLNAKDGLDEGYKLLLSFPPLDHIINLSGDMGLEIISKAYSSWKIQDIGENKTKPLITKMKDVGSRGLIFHSSVGNQNLMSKLKANLNPRFTDSATAQVSTSVKKSFKRLFSKDSVEPSTNIPQPTKSNFSQSIEESRAKANEFHALAESLSQSLSGKTSPTAGQNGSQEQEPRQPPKRSLSLSLKLRNNSNNDNGTSENANAKVQTENEKNDKIRQSVIKVNKKTIKKWDKMMKNVEKQNTSELKRLDKNILLNKKKEKAAMMGQNAEANASTAARSDVLSAETASKIMASREARVDREVERKAEKKRDEDTQKIADTKRTRIETGTGKLYHKTIAKQIAEFNKIRSKYLI